MTKGAVAKYKWLTATSVIVSVPSLIVTRPNHVLTFWILINLALLINLEYRD
jgi:hypothetical protein